MTERPILMSAPMVRAILAGTKTQTRRVLKRAGGPSVSVDYEDGAAEVSRLHGDGPGYEVHETVTRIPCPYGVPGDRLWVRETWRAPGAVPRSDDPARPGMRIEYRADQAEATDGFAWRPSIFMPRTASRITLEVTGIRVERLQGISKEDALAEGIFYSNYWQGYGGEEGRYFHCTDPRRSYEGLWEHINGPDSWDANPWVWVVEFKRVGQS